ncbi:uncharacterized protein LOC113391239 [Ctenocephalides felis]|uniref:uncharacterized protein LOC113391239 n=1 Tax=Ctenocephalides felis TaxID=7515 RepID=UPI000E6E3D14|nr:uncharacterized protein LOC113391239 [Ctenocephalides felis]
MGISLRCRRYLLFSYIVVLALLGVGITLCAGYLLLDVYSLSHGLVLHSSAWSPMAALCCCGVAAIFFAWYGWGATSKRKISKLNMLTWMLIFLAGALFATCGVSLAFRHTVGDRSTEHIEISLTRRSGRGVSWSCCSAAPGGEHISTPFGSSCASVYQRGCLDVLIDSVRLLLVYSAGAALVSGLVVGAGLFCVCQLSGKLKSLAKVPPVSYKPGSGRTRTEVSARRFSDVDTIDKV